jgi:hypothetical protein
MLGGVFLDFALSRRAFIEVTEEDFFAIPFPPMRFLPIGGFLDKIFLILEPIP